MSHYAIQEKTSNTFSIPVFLLKYITYIFKQDMNIKIIEIKCISTRAMRTHIPV